MIAGAGFARMAWREALRRTVEAMPEAAAERYTQSVRSPKAEYNRIIDRAMTVWNMRHGTYRPTL